MFKNPLKYQQGGQLNEQQQQMLAAFIDWLPKRVKEFQGMKPEAIVQALDGMSKTSEGQKQVQQLMEQFQQESQSGQSFKKGGKIQDFICKHGRGGNITGCGCNKSVEKAEMGSNGIGRFKVPFLADMMTYFTGRKTPNVGKATRRSFGYARLGGDQYYRETANINGNTTDTYVKITPSRDTLIRQVLPSGRVNDLDQYQREAILQRFRPDINRVNTKENGGKVEKAQLGLSGMPVNPKFIFNLGLKAAPGIIGSAALGSYAATKNNQSSGGGSR